MRIFFGHDEAADGEGSRFVAMQRAASAAGLAYLDASSHLCLPPQIRALVRAARHAGLRRRRVHWCALRGSLHACVSKIAAFHRVVR